MVMKTILISIVTLISLGIISCDVRTPSAKPTSSVTTTNDIENDSIEIQPFRNIDIIRLTPTEESRQRAKEWLILREQQQNDK